jgi:Flp pilus assembly protein TadD
MRIALAHLAIAAPLMLAAYPVQAQEADQVASTTIARGAYADAEKALVKELRIYPGRPELLLNLAAVYAKTGRDAEARDLYAKVLSQREVLMDVTPEQTAGSHAIARTGLRRLENVQLSAR